MVPRCRGSTFHVEHAPSWPGHAATRWRLVAASGGRRSGAAPTADRLGRRSGVAHVAVPVIPVVPRGSGSRGHRASPVRRPRPSRRAVRTGCSAALHRVARPRPGPSRRAAAAWSVAPAVRGGPARVASPCGRAAVSRETGGRAACDSVSGHLPERAHPTTCCGPVDATPASPPPRNEPRPAAKRAGPTPAKRAAPPTRSEPHRPPREASPSDPTRSELHATRQK
jgi:hypothetical protein